MNFFIMTVKKMQYLYITQNNEVSVKHVEEGEEFNVGDALGCSDVSYLSSPKCHEENRNKLREQALKMIKEGKSISKVREMIEKSTQSERFGSIQRRGMREEFIVSKIPEKITGGKKIYVAWKKRSKVSLEECSFISVILSVCMEKVIGENKRGDTVISNQYFTYKGPCILFSDWEPKEFKFSLTSTDKDKDKMGGNKRLFLAEKDFWSIFQGGQLHLQQREYQRQLALYNRQEGKKHLFEWLKSEEVLADIEEDFYREVLKRFLFPIAEHYDLYEVVKKRVMLWQEEDRVFLKWLKEHGGIEKWKLPFVPLRTPTQEKEEEKLQSLTQKKEKSLKEDDEFFIYTAVMKKKEQMVEEYVINPLTGRKIKKGGANYLHLVKNGVI